MSLSLAIFEKLSLSLSSSITLLLMFSVRSGGGAHLLSLWLVTSDLLAQLILYLHIHR